MGAAAGSGELNWNSLLSTLGYDAVSVVWGFDPAALRALPEEAQRAMLSYTLRLDTEQDLDARIAACAELPVAERLPRVLSDARR